jgi:formylglycine-generating enzyme required for sulfatase activity
LGCATFSLREFDVSFQLAPKVNKDAGVKDTTPVRRYPLGASPYGVHDMAGNVWEWTSTISDKEFSYPYQADDGRENPDSVDKNHVLRGGYWDNSAKYVRAGFRTNYGIKGDLARGFRVVSASLAPF